jgi:hypothetical protein
VTTHRFSRSIWRGLLAAPALVSLALVTLAPPASAATTPTGYDISYPQCSTRASSYPQQRAFGIVGVNGGTAATANPCLGPSNGYTSELSWAAASPGLPNQPRASFYLNTADPGPVVASWPAAGSGPKSCDNTWSAGCAYDYGYAKATYSFGLARSAANADAARGLPTTTPSADPWWIDVETTNTWATPGNTPSWASVNIAALQGFAGGLTAAGVSLARVGFYSTAFQWAQITGLTPATSPTYFSTSEPNWIPGATSLAQAQANCLPGHSFTGGPVTLTQYRASSFDGDYRCPSS